MQAGEGRRESCRSLSGRELQQGIVLRTNDFRDDDANVLKQRPSEQILRAPETMDSAFRKWANRVFRQGPDFYSCCSELSRSLRATAVRIVPSVLRSNAVRDGRGRGQLPFVANLIVVSSAQNQASSSSTGIQTCRSSPLGTAMLASSFRRAMGSFSC